ncbi:MAG: hypothetical protein DRP47_07715 [Candidatus Zixiibacteriota bacterium]|nr:MAG: hypothetical protein DRP47_07715 [candidate division Zixibacteria bacterium]
MSTYNIRIKNLEKKIPHQTKLIEFLKLKREFYNLMVVSDAVLIASIRSYLEDYEIPKWAKEEFYKKIPNDASKHLVKVAEANAHDELDLRSSNNNDKIMSKIKIEEIYKSTCELLKFDTLEAAQKHFEIEEKNTLFLTLRLDT